MYQLLDKIELDRRSCSDQLGAVAAARSGGVLVKVGDLALALLLLSKALATRYRNNLNPSSLNRLVARFEMRVKTPHIIRPGSGSFRARVSRSGWGQLDLCSAKHTAWGSIGRWLGVRSEPRYLNFGVSVDEAQPRPLSAIVGLYMLVVRHARPITAASDDTSSSTIVPTDTMTSTKRLPSTSLHD